MSRAEHSSEDRARFERDVVPQLGQLYPAALRTEIDALNGALVAEAQALGVPTPVNEHLWRQVREREGRPLPANAPPPGA